MSARCCWKALVSLALPEPWMLLGNECQILLPGSGFFGFARALDGFGKLVPDSVARLWRAPPYAAKRKDLVSATWVAYAAKAIAGARLSFATVRFAPITVVAHRAKAGPFRRSSILFRPHTPQMTGRIGGVAGYRPRVRAVYYGCVYRHSLGYPRHPQHRRARRLVQGMCKPSAKENAPKVSLGRAPTSGAA